MGDNDWLRLSHLFARELRDWSHSPASLPTTPAHQQTLHADMATDAAVSSRPGARRAGKLHEPAERDNDVNGGLHSLLLEMMAMDSDKHARLPHFVRMFESRAQADDDRKS